MSISEGVGELDGQPGLRQDHAVMASSVKE